MKRFLLFLLALLCATPARAHIGSKDIYQQITVGPYKLFVTVRPPTVIPGLATLDVRSEGAHITTLRIASLPLTGEAAQHPPLPEDMQASPADAAVFTGETWLMASGSWQVRFEINGDAGPATASLPVPAVPLHMLPMQRGLGITLGCLGVFLIVTFTGMMASAVRESQLEPDATPTPGNRRHASIVAAVTLIALVVALWFGAKWWRIDDRNYSADIYHPLQLHPTLHGDTLRCV